MSDFPLPRILDFIKRVSPFDALSGEDLAGVVATMEIAYCPRGEAILRAGGEPAASLHVIQSGSVKISVADESGSEVLVDVRGEGDAFGAVSILQGGRALFDVTALEDVIAYCLPAQVFRRLVEERPAFRRHFSFSLVHDIKMAKGPGDRYLSKMTGADSLGLDEFLRASAVSDLMTSAVLTCAPLTPVRAAALRMTERGVSSIIVQDEAGRPLGILTDTDLRARVLAQGLPPAAPAVEVMSAPLATIHPKAYAFEAMLEMARHGVHHLAVTESERLVGVISDHDLKVPTGESTVGVVKEIDKVESAAELAGLSPRIDQVLKTLLRLGGSAEYILDLVGVFYDRLTLRLLKLTEEEMAAEGRGRAPCPWLWLALGAAGRQEQTLRHDQDNGLVYLSSAKTDPPAQAQVKAWFAEFGRRAVEGLRRCGFGLCRVELMASNPLWRQSEEEWRRTVLSLVRRPPPELSPVILKALFDLRGLPVAGPWPWSWESELRQEILSELRRHPGFLPLLAQPAPEAQVPLGFLRQFVVEKSGAYTDRLNLKLSGLVPVVDAARVLALDTGTGATNTLARLSEAARLGAIRDSLAAELREAYGFITLFRTARHLEAGGAKGEAIAPGGVNKQQRQMLKESFAVISELMAFMRRRYPSGTA